MQGSKLYVGNLKYSVTEEEVQELFSQVGEVVEVKIIGDKGFGFVEMSSQEEAENAKEKFNGFEFQGRNLRVDEARPPKKRSRRRDFRRY
jgi:RNA recognition motif-containing protein